MYFCPEKAGSEGYVPVCLFHICKKTKKEIIMQKMNVEAKKRNKSRKPIRIGKIGIGLWGMAYMLFVTAPMTAFAAGPEAVTQPLENLKSIVIAVIGAVGVIILAKNVMEFAQAYQQQDSSTMNSALKGVVAGIMMAGISTVLSFLGF